MRLALPRRSTVLHTFETLLIGGGGAAFAWLARFVFVSIATPGIVHLFDRPQDDADDRRMTIRDRAAQTTAGATSMRRAGGWLAD